MYSLTLELNQICNLNCRYCYLGEKSGEIMSGETAKQAIKLAFQNTKMHKDKKLWIDFIGGEPLLSFEMIKGLVAYIEEKNTQYQYELLYSMTTNAVLLSERFVDYIIKKGFNLKISLDGKKEVNDKNRISWDGISVHDQVIQHLELLRRYEWETGKYVQVTNVITRNNFKNYYETLVYLTDVVGIKIIDSSMDLTIAWNDEELNEFERILQTTLKYFLDRATEGKGFQWDFAHMMVRCQNKKQRFYTCGGGIVSMYVRTDGSIYACPGNLRSEAILGSVMEGLDRQKIYQLKSMKGIKSTRCSACELYESCTANSCVMQNMLLTGDINTPAPILCKMQKMLYRVYKNNEEVLLRVRM